MDNYVVTINLETGEVTARKGTQYRNLDTTKFYQYQVSAFSKEDAREIAAELHFKARV